MYAVTAEGLVWELVHHEICGPCYSLTVRQIAQRAGLSVGAVHGTKAWWIYSRGREAEKAANRENRIERGYPVKCV
jgi:hypothetical protein